LSSKAPQTILPNRPLFKPILTPAGGPGIRFGCLLFQIGCRLGGRALAPAKNYYASISVVTRRHAPDFAPAVRFF
jgi:hypothetical protein